MLELCSFLVPFSWLFVVNIVFDACRCRFDVDLTDHTDTLTASVFGDLAETLLTFTALEAMNYHEEVGYISIKKP